MKKKLKKKRFPGLFDFLNYKGDNPKVLKFLFNPPGMRFGMKMLARMFKATTLPLINRIHPWPRNDKNRLFVIPVETTVERGEDVTLPYQIAEEFIRRASFRVIMDFCPCRKAGECQVNLLANRLLTNVLISNLTLKIKSKNLILLNFYFLFALSS